MTDRSDITTSPWPHRWAVVMCCATFPLIWVGALVTTYDAGMAVPDWPSTYGYNLFLYPWQTWLFGPFDLFVEHGHRLLGSLVGLLAIGCVASAFLIECSRAVRALAVIALVAVIGQGLLGGARVLLDARTLAMIHGCVGPAFFALAAVVAVVASRRWQVVNQTEVSRSMFISCVTTAVLAYVQLVFGAMLRHVPVDAGPYWFRTAVIFHVLTALLIAGHILASGFKTLRTQSDPWLTRPTVALMLLVSLQLVLGVGTWVSKYAWPAALGQFEFAAGYTITANSLVQSLIVTSHVAVGSLILATSVVLAVRAGRLLKWESSKAPFDARVGGLAV
jgi:cytochrome c oxidase assembly protein subunit 15